MTDIIVHGIPGSPYIRTVLMMLEEKGLPYALRPIGFGENRTDAYRAIHPFQKIPTIDHGDFRLYETSAILNYLDGLTPAPALRPADPKASARMDQVISIVNAYLAERLSKDVSFPLLVAPKFGIPVDAKAVRAAIPAAAATIDELARLLGDHPFMAGAALGQADLMAAPHLCLLTDFAEGRAMLAPHAGLRAWIERMRARPSFSATEWETLLKRWPVREAA
jgi:glutathione S-transferase